MAILSRADLRSRVRHAARTGEAQRARERADLTRAETAKRFKVDVITIYRWETDRRVPVGNNLVAYYRFLERLGVDLAAEDPAETGREAHSEAV